jgi:hypothetical protein
MYSILRNFVKSWFYIQGNYKIAYTIPAAGHDRVFESVLHLQKYDARRFLFSSTGKSIFLSDYVDQMDKDAAKKLEVLLNLKFPKFQHPVGIIINIEKQ